MIRQVVTGVMIVVSFCALVRADRIDLEPSLAGYWKLNDPSGSASALDASANGYAGSVVGGVSFGSASALASLGTAAAFNGSTGKIDVPYQAALNAASFSFEAFARYTGGGTHNSVLTSRDGPTPKGYVLYRAPDAGGQWQFWTGNNSSWDAMSGNLPAVQNRWTHLAGTYDAATNTKAIYANGHLAASGNPVGGVVVNPLRPLRIGAGATEGAGQFFFNGQIDNVAVFNQALGHQTISDHYNSFSRYASRVLGDSPAGYWRLGEQTTFANGLPATPVWNSVNVNALRGSCYTNVQLNQADSPLVGDIDTSALFSGAANIKVDVDYSAALNPVSFTVETWAKVEGGAGTYRSPLTSRTASGGTGGYILYAQDNNQWALWTGDGTGGGWSTLVGGAVVSNQWTHLAATFQPAGGPDGTGTYTGTAALYVNGVRTATSAGMRYKPNGNTPLRIGAGASESNGSYWFNGKIDETAVYGAALSRQQIVDHFVSATSPAARLVGYWAMEDPAAPGLASDVSGHDLHGQYSAGVLLGQTGPGGFDAAARFAGGTRVNLGQPSALTALSNNFTLAAWINPDAAGGWRRFLARDRSSTNAGFGFGVSGTNELAFTTWGVKDYYSGTVIPAGQWSHVAVVFDAYNTAHFYVNGVLVNSVAGPGPVSAGGLGDFLIGTDSYYGQHFAGLIDEVAIWNGALTSDQLLQHFNGTLHEAFVPEPVTLTMALAGLAGLARYARRRRSGR